MGTSAKNTDNIVLQLGFFTAVLVGFEHLAALFKADETIKAQLEAKLAADDGSIATLNTQLANITAATGQPLPDDLTARVQALLNDPLLNPTPPVTATPVYIPTIQADYNTGVSLAQAGSPLPADANADVTAGFNSVPPKPPTSLPTGETLPPGAYASTPGTLAPGSVVPPAGSPPLTPTPADAPPAQPATSNATGAPLTGSENAQ